MTLATVTHEMTTKSLTIEPEIRPDSDSSGAWAALVLITGGMLFGVSHLDPDYWPLAWLGLAMTAGGMIMSPQRLFPSLGLLFGGLFGH